ncbi:E3 ubiquitin-protein ligase NRDP1 [Halotydeus destructor]|nr:E3 ubiquitin-protein ligase NRDP1 [Halotydeus destructor]
MGFDPDLFLSPILPELICVICEGVFESPIQCEDEHVFCKDCIKMWTRKSKCCPVDMKQLDAVNMKTVPRFLRELINNMKLRCTYTSLGCDHTDTVEYIIAHQARCKYSSKKRRPPMNGGDCLVIDATLPETHIYDKRKREVMRIVHELEAENNKLKTQIQNLALNLNMKETLLVSYENEFARFSNKEQNGLQ